MLNAMLTTDPIESARRAAIGACGRHKARTAAALTALIALAAYLLAPPAAFAGIFGDLGLKSLVEGLLGAAQSELGLLGGLDMLTAPFDQLFGKGNTGSANVAAAVKAVWKGAVLPCATTVLAAIFMLQLLNIAQRMEGAGAMPGMKDVVFLLIFYAVFLALISNSFEIMQAIYEALNSVTSHAGEAMRNAGLSDGSPGTKFDVGTDDDAKLATLAVVALVAMLINFFAGILTYAVLWARAFQIYIMAALSPIPLALLGNDNTRQMGIGFLKNFCAICLASLIIYVLFMIYPYLILAVVGDSGTVSVTNVGASLVKFLAVSILYIFALTKSGGWAQSALGS